ncbi:hypothetical protein ACFLQU_02255 [Verrucomicrobiota bacterium]
MATQCKVFFERVGLLQGPLLLYHLARGHEVVVFNLRAMTGYSFPSWVGRLIAKRRVKQVYVILSPAQGRAIDEASAVVDGMHDHAARKLLVKMFGSDEADLILKKMLVTKVFTCLHTHSYLLSLGQSGRDTVLVPDTYTFVVRMLREHGKQMRELPSYVRVSKWGVLAARIGRACRSLKLIAIAVGLCGLRLGLFFRAGAGRGRAFVVNEYAVLLNSELVIRGKGLRAFDFLLDHERIRKDNTVFLLSDPSAPKGWEKQKRAEGYNVVRASRSLADVCRCALDGAQGEYVGLWRLIRVWFGRGCMADVLLNALVSGMVVRMHWSGLLKGQGIRKLVYTNSDGWSQIGANILIRQSGGTTWDYASFVGGSLLHSRPDAPGDMRHVFWAFKNCDNMLAVNDASIDYYKSHRQVVRKYHAIGSIYSEMVRLAAARADRKMYVREHFGIDVDNGVKVVCYFDTTFVDDDEAFTSYDEGITSYRDILRLLEDDERMVIVVKSSKNDDYYAAQRDSWSSGEKGNRLLALFGDIKKHPRALWAGAAGDSPVIMAVSDLVITHCMSSPTLEALGSGKRAIWYESGRRHAGVEYDSIPGLVMHGYDQLRERVGALLDRIGDEEYSEYLENHVKGRIQSHLDGRALTRFRELLAG